MSAIRKEDVIMRLGLPDDEADNAELFIQWLLWSMEWKRQQSRTTRYELDKAIEALSRKYPDSTHRMMLMGKLISSYPDLIDS